ncbi:response regulator transcription factor [Kribbella sp. HUAS MG21]|uniref:Response regulator transcription factor n=1 Tax=Kribbella sp. HUAS MG21 TaxID=3160966 RepID=A0AAU7T7M3_9ACTN
MIRVVVVDSHAITRFGLGGLMAGQDDLELVADADSARAAFPAIRRTEPDVVTLEIALPDGDGLEVARDLLRLRPDLGIVILTSASADELLFRAADTGVSAFVTKTAPVDEVLAAIRHAAVAARSFTATGLMQALTRRAAAPAGPQLSRREHEVLDLLAEGLSVPAIARAMYLSHPTAKTYVARLYDKLGASNRSQALMAALRRGLLDPTAFSDLNATPERAAARV